MKQFIFYTLVCMLFIACADTKKEADQVQDAMSEGIKIMKELPEIEKEIEEAREKIASNKLDAVFTANVDGKTILIDDWDMEYSRGSLFDSKANFQFASDKEQDYKIVINVVGMKGSIYNDLPLTELAPALSVFDYSDTESLKKFENGMAYVTIYKGDDNLYSSAKGTVTVLKLNNEALEINWEGEGFKGDWREKVFVPFEASIKAEYDFITDYRGQ